MIIRSTDVRGALRSRERQRGWIMNPFRYGVGDPYFPNVPLLLHFNGADTSPTAIDSSSYANTMSASGNAQLSTTNALYGSACGLFDGTGDYWATTNRTEFTFPTGDFTIEGWVRPATVSGIDTIITNRSSSGSDYNWLVRMEAGVFRCIAWGPTAGTLLIDLFTGSVSTGVYTHWAFVRSGNDFASYLGGTQQATANSSSSLASSSTGSAGALYIGHDPSTAGRNFDGRMDEIRITKGVARYTSNFTPPTGPFPNST